MKNNFGFILIKPQLSENIGACARSIKNFGFSKLLIVSPKNPFTLKDLNIFYSSNVGIFGESIYPIFWEGPPE